MSYSSHIRGLDVLDTRVIAALHTIQSADDRGGRLSLADIMRATGNTAATPGIILDLCPLYASDEDGVATRLLLRADDTGSWRVLDLMRVGAPDRPALPMILRSSRPMSRVLTSEHDLDLVREGVAA